MEPKCINLRQRFGREFKVRYEESYFAERGDRARADDPALQIIPGFRGHVYPAGPDRLAAFCRPGTKARELRALPGVEVWTDGDDGVTVFFQIALLDHVAELLQLRRRRKPLTEEQRQRLVAIGTANLTRINNATQKSGSEMRPGVPTPQVDLFDGAVEVAAQVRAPGPSLENGVAMARPGLRKHPKFLLLCQMLGECEAHTLGHLELLWETAYEAGPVWGATFLSEKPWRER